MGEYRLTVKLEATSDKTLQEQLRHSVFLSADGAPQPRPDALSAAASMPAAGAASPASTLTWRVGAPPGVLP